MLVAKYPGTGVSELARNTASSKTTIFRMLRTLEHHQMVRQAKDGTYWLGNAMLVLSTAASSQIDLVKFASPILEELTLKVNETVQMRVRDKMEALCIAKFEPSRDLRVHAVVGRRRPLYAGSSKVLLAYMPAEDQDEIIASKRPALTPRTITDAGRLRLMLQRIKEQGYCISRGEVSEQLVSVSVPVFAVDGSVVAAINIAAPAFRTQDTEIVRFTKLLAAAAGRISERLGWEPRTRIR
ncbi:IclR family transcriptional regulator [Chelativorans sp. AA-79]|uniref:IclR family transcriptional regulator n=1 Tax=Chelativorans sp. AA-79 TaxID=3028735 RepID=UPI0023F75797|nr:IclR family transcriptional regulator [Chelativorans sp. AA-79]WEX09032.1 IclR family transcriptional regulator [Chelativorans sp. AA-79]